MDKSFNETIGIDTKSSQKKEQTKKKTTIKQALMSKKIKFTGGFGEYFIMSIGLMILSVITLGLATPYWMYWSLKYFFTRLEIED